MGNSAPQAVAFTDRKSIIKAHCLERVPYDSPEHVDKLVRAAATREATGQEAGIHLGTAAICTAG